MELRDWALITFTILAQTSVGAFWVLCIVHYFAARKAGVEEADRMSDRALLAIVPVLGLGMLASLLHLGNPLSAYKAVTHFGSSWLSREVMFGVLFVVFGLVYSFMQWRKLGSIAIRTVLAWVTALLGLAMIVSMSNIYMVYTQPSWNTYATPISFFVTTLLLGSLAMGAAYVWNYNQVQKKNPDCADVQCELMRTALRWIAIASVVLVGIEFVVLPIYLVYLSTGNAAATASLAMFYSKFGLVFFLRLFLVFVGAVVLGLFLYQNASSAGQVKVLGNVVYSAFALVFVAEVMGRFLFYMTHQGIGL